MSMARDSVVRCWKAKRIPRQRTAKKFAGLWQKFESYMALQYTGQEQAMTSWIHVCVTLHKIPIYIYHIGIVVNDWIMYYIVLYCIVMHSSFQKNSGRISYHPAVDHPGQPQKDQHQRLFGDDPSGTSSACVEEGAGPAFIGLPGGIIREWTTSQAQNKEANYRDVPLPFEDWRPPLWCQIFLSQQVSIQTKTQNADSSYSTGKLIAAHATQQISSRFPADRGISGSDQVAAVMNQVVLPWVHAAPGHDASGMPRHKALCFSQFFVARSGSISSKKKSNV